MIKKFFVILLVFFLALPLFTKSIVAQDNSLEMKVDHVAGKFEKLKEKVVLLTKFSKVSKAKYHQLLLEKRLAELSYVVESGQLDLVEPSASRYATYAGRLSDYIVGNNVSDEKDEVVALFDRHAKIIDSLQRNFEYESGWWFAIQHDVNSTKIFSDTVSKI